MAKQVLVLNRGNTVVINAQDFENFWEISGNVEILLLFKNADF